MLLEKSSVSNVRDKERVHDKSRLSLSRIKHTSGSKSSITASEQAGTKTVRRSAKAGILRLTKAYSRGDSSQIRKIH